MLLRYYGIHNIWRVPSDPPCDIEEKTYLQTQHCPSEHLSSVANLKLYNVKNNIKIIVNVIMIVLVYILQGAEAVNAFYNNL